MGTRRQGCPGGTTLAPRPIITIQQLYKSMPSSNISSHCHLHPHTMFLQFYTVPYAYSIERMSETKKETWPPPSTPSLSTSSGKKLNSTSLNTFTLIRGTDAPLADLGDVGILGWTAVSQSGSLFWVRYHLRFCHPCLLSQHSCSVLHKRRIHGQTFHGWNKHISMSKSDLKNVKSKKT